MVPSPLLLELLSCPLCARSLETLELELGDLEGEADGLHDFPQVRMHVGALVVMVNGKDEGCGWKWWPNKVTACLHSYDNI